MLRQIEIYTILKLLGGDSGILGVFGSWKDTYDDEDALKGLNAIREGEEIRLFNARSDAPSSQLPIEDQIREELARVIQLKGGDKMLSGAIRRRGMTLVRRY